jgi:predicted N-acyltransferase
VPHLHFELCYYQAIEAAIARGLQRVEAGAQGRAQAGARLSAGADLLRPSFRDPRLGEAVAAYLEAEREAVAHEIGALDEHSPFRKE